MEENLESMSHIELTVTTEGNAKLQPVRGPRKDGREMIEQVMQVRSHGGEGTKAVGTPVGTAASQPWSGRQGVGDRALEHRACRCYFLCTTW